jgi:FAD/FMN-containing dehydrogenase
MILIPSMVPPSFVYLLLLFLLLLLPPILLKGITVGGSLQGLAAESTSFKFGFVHDAIIGFEAVLSDGKILWCSPQSNADLFYSLPGVNGST